MQWAVWNQNTRDKSDMKSKYSEKKTQELAEKASRLGYQLIDLSDRYDYRDRKYKTYGLIDRRNNRLACAYGCFPDIEKFLEKTRNYD